MNALAEQNKDLLLVTGAIAGALRYGDTETAKTLAMLGIELGNCTGDKTEIHRKINEAAGYSGTSSHLD